jgi:hypothetical protein
METSGKESLPIVAIATEIQTHTANPHLQSTQQEVFQKLEKL